MILELHERDTEVLEQILSILKNHPEIEKIEVDEEPMVSLPGLEIFPSRRKVFRDRQEIQLTAKEYRILLLLAANKGRVLTYAQIYEQVWGDFTTGNENNTIGFHICNLREKLYRAILDEGEGHIDVFLTVPLQLLDLPQPGDVGVDGVH